MRWSIIRLIWLRDLRDQLRDRRTVVMIALLPLVLYPALSIAVMQFAVRLGEKPSTIGIVSTSGDFPARADSGARLHPAPIAAWLAFTPAAPGGTGLDRLLGAAALARAGGLLLDYPPLASGDKFVPLYAAGPGGKLSAMLRIKRLASDDRAALDTKEVDLILSAPADFWERIAQDAGPAPFLQVQSRADDRSLQARVRLRLVLDAWKKHLKEVRLVRRGLPAQYDDPVVILDPDLGKLSAAAGGGLFGLMVKIFPFMLVMWALAGALYPAVDVCAGEKERGTMETLIISPASREEIVLGKFLTIWVFSAGTSVLNLFSMGITAWQFGSQFPGGQVLRPGGLLWCLVLLLPLSAFFSALCLAVGAYARSSKEGQYYLMPLFLVVMPLVFLTLAPGVELSPFYSLVPITGVALLMQRLMGPAAATASTWLYLLPVLAPMALYSWLSLRWAIDQFKREEVLFREAERLDIGLWLRRLFRDKETLPSAGQAAFCFGLIMALRWLAAGIGSRQPELVQTAVVLLALVGAPAVFMALLLTTRPRLGLGLRPVSVGEMLTALMLAAVVIGPLVQLTLTIYDQLSLIKEMVEEHRALAEVFDELAAGRGSAGWAVLALVILPAVCEELAFRGFILTGLLRRFRPWPAILLSSFLFSLYHMNVFQLLPTFILGVVLGILAVRSRSILPSMLFHLLYNGLLISSTLLQRQVEQMDMSSDLIVSLRLAATALCTILAGLLLWRLGFASPLPTAERKGPARPS